MARTPRPKPTRPDALIHVGGPTVILDYAGLRFVSDPTFDPPGSTYRLGRLRLKKLAKPAVSLSKVGWVDAVLLSHDTHPDNFDDAGRELAAKAGKTITTPAATKHLSRAIGLHPWHTETFEGRDRVVVTVTAVPARHAMWGAHWLAGPVTGFLVSAPGRSIVYFTGDNVSRKAIRQVAHAAVVDVAVLHAGAPRFRRTGPIRYCLTAKQAARAAKRLRARRVLIVHSEGWEHFSETMADVDAAFSTPELEAVRIVAPMGKRVEIQGGLDYGSRLDRVTGAGYVGKDVDPDKG
ncbi:MAG: MBL fold metallo-hydrolase [Demequinaceae bacterium]|nr:MBL fold metallo-hydrolase [Demequinaceae bacterium]